MEFLLWVFGIISAIYITTAHSRTNCPDSDRSLISWRPGNQPHISIVIGQGRKYVLEASTVLKSIRIEKGGKLVIRDRKTITISVKNILIADGGEFHIGSETCRYEGKVTIILRGKSTDSEKDPNFGRKFIGVTSGGTLELHGQDKLSWTQLTKTLGEGNLPFGGFNKRVYNRGINVYVIDKNTAQVLRQGNFDTYAKADAAPKLIKFLKEVSDGSVLAIFVCDEASRKLTREARAAIKALGSRFIETLALRQPFTFVGIKGNPSTFIEGTKPYKGTKTTEWATAEKIFKGSNGVSFKVSLVSGWDPKAWARSEIHINAASSDTIINVKDDVRSWKPGDKVVIASTDWDPMQAEEFDLKPCPECSSKQVKLNGVPKYNHFGKISDGVDMRGEVGLLTRNILIKGETEKNCYGNNWCQYFSFDTYGGHIKILKGFKSVHISGVELTAMGQQVSGFYPIHFHMCLDVDEKGGYTKPTYVKDTSIHHCFSRCVTIHTTHGLLVKNTVGYDTLGHCYFLEDGVEQRNTLDGNLGLLTRPGTILPSDRDLKMCKEILNGVYGNYKPNPYTQCLGVTTFWISHPNNNLLNNAAAGSADTGIWYIFHREPSGPSKGMLRPFEAEHSPMGIFKNNRAHSNIDKALMIEGGVKVTPASRWSPAEFLSLVGSRYKPHRNSDLKQPRVPAVIDGLTAFKNVQLGAWVRGGDIFFRNCAFADHPTALTMASEGAWPNDPGSHQEVRNSIFVGESENRGTCTHGWNCIPGGDGIKRAMPWWSDKYPLRGVDIYDGPILVADCTFLKFYKTAKRESSAIGFHLVNYWQNCPYNNVTRAKFDSVSQRVFVGQKGGAFGSYDKDGDKTSIFHDVDGSVTGVRDSYVVRPDNYLMRHTSCQERSDWKGAVCKGKYAQMYIYAETPHQEIIMVRDEHPDKPLTLASPMRAFTKNSLQYQPVILLEKSYTIHWKSAAPKFIKLYPVNFNRGDWVRVGLCYPKGTTFVVQRVQYVPYKTYPIRKVNSLSQVDSGQDAYYFDENTGMLFVKVYEAFHRLPYYYHSIVGQEHVAIRASVASSAVADCRSKAYPKYRKWESTGNLIVG